MNRQLGSIGKPTACAWIALSAMLLLMLAAEPAIATEAAEAGPCDGEGNPPAEACVGDTPCGSNGVYLYVDNPVMAWKQCFNRPGSSLERSAL